MALTPPNSRTCALSQKTQTNLGLIWGEGCAKTLAGGKKVQRLQAARSFILSNSQKVFEGATKNTRSHLVEPSRHQPGVWVPGSDGAVISPRGHQALLRQKLHGPHRAIVRLDHVLQGHLGKSYLGICARCQGFSKQNHFFWPSLTHPFRPPWVGLAWVTWARRFEGKPGVALKSPPRTRTPVQALCAKAPAALDQVASLGSRAALRGPAL